MKNILFIPDSSLGHKLNSNTAIFVKREISKENYYTNEFGWRVENKGEQYKEKELGFFGCSWTMGVGNDYCDSIVGHIEKILQKPSNNLGVGSYSLLQINLAIKKNIKFLLKSKIYIMYGSWQLDRCIKDRATAMTFRPILTKNSKNEKFQINEPKNPPFFLVSTFIKINNSKLFFKKFLLKLLIAGSAIYHGIFIRFIEKIFNLQKWTRLNIKNDRNKILNYCLNDLTNIAKKYNKKISILHLPAFNRKIDTIKELSDLDKETISNFVKESNFIDYYYLEESEKEFLNYFNTNEINEIFWQDTNHPNGKGSKIIAEEISNIIK
mgnify:CR=1 FL=1|tara:strand:+ start:230 stop:1201 length:972 start_codon:yes stop_codon:yes gene_type:complete